MSISSLTSLPAPQEEIGGGGISPTARSVAVAGFSENAPVKKQQPESSSLSFPVRVTGKVAEACIEGDSTFARVAKTLSAIPSIQRFPSGLPQLVCSYLLLDREREESIQQELLSHNFNLAAMPIDMREQLNADAPLIREVTVRRSRDGGGGAADLREDVIVALKKCFRNAEVFCVEEDQFNGDKAIEAVSALENLRATTLSPASMGISSSFSFFTGHPTLQSVSLRCRAGMVDQDIFEVLTSLPQLEELALPDVFYSAAKFGGRFNLNEGDELQGAFMRLKNVKKLTVRTGDFEHFMQSTQKLVALRSLPSLRELHIVRGFMYDMPHHNGLETGLFRFIDSLGQRANSTFRAVHFHSASISDELIKQLGRFVTNIPELHLTYSKTEPTESQGVALACLPNFKSVTRGPAQD